MRFADLVSSFFEVAPRDENGNYLISGTPAGSAQQRLNIEEFALFSVIDLLSSTAALCEWRTYKADRRLTGEDWYQWNYEPNPDQSGAEFKRLLFARLFRFNEALIFPRNGSYYIADNFVREAEGFAPAVYSGITYRGAVLPGTLPESEVLYIPLAPSAQARALRSNLCGLYSAAIQEAWDKYRKSGGKSGILKIGARASGKPSFEADLEKLMNDRFKNFFASKNAVLPLTDGYEYVPQNGPSTQKSTSEVSDIDNLLRQAQTTACNAYHIPPSILRGEVTNLDDAVNSMLSFAVRPPIRAVETVINRRIYGRGLLEGWRMRISTTGIKSVDVLSQADKAEKLIQNRLYNPNGIREIFGDEPIPEDWADEYVLTKNVATMGIAQKEV